MEFKKPQTIYDQIADHICENILSKRWQCGEKIPSVRDMAMLAEVNPNTVMRAYAALQEREIIENKRGIGYFVAGDSIEKVRTMKKKEFVCQELPGLLRTMELLGIDCKELDMLCKSRGFSEKGKSDETER